MRGAPFGLRPCKVHNHLMLLCCRERPMCRSALIERYLLTYIVSGDLSPLISRLRDSFPPKGKPSIGSANCIKSASNFNSSYFQRLRTLQGRSLRIAPRFPLLTNLNHFYPVAEMRQGNKLPPHKSRSTGFGSEQPEIVARQTAASKSCTNKKKGVIIPLVEGLEGS